MFQIYINEELLFKIFIFQAFYTKELVLNSVFDGKLKDSGTFIAGHKSRQ